MTYSILIVHVSEQYKQSDDVGFSGDIDSWKAYFDAGEPQTLPLPGKWDDKLGVLEKLSVLRALRPDKVILGIQDYIAETMGQKYIEPPPFDLPLSYVSSTPTNPMLFVLSVKQSISNML